jgi:hypothetical protein
VDSNIFVLPTRPMRPSSRQHDDKHQPLEEGKRRRESWTRDSDIKRMLSTTFGLLTSGCVIWNRRRTGFTERFGFATY